jgi:predicted nucleic acid-binding protein
MKVYLDLCAIQRPLDTYDQIRITLEAEAVLGIVALCDAERLELVSSEALEYESEQNALPVRQEHAQAVLAKAQIFAAVTTPVEQRAEAFVKLGVKPLDALHLALAESAGADYFCTCDDRLLRKIRRIQALKVQAISPVDLVQELEQ